MSKREAEDAVATVLVRKLEEVSKGELREWKVLESLSSQLSEEERCRFIAIRSERFISLLRDATHSTEELCEALGVDFHVAFNKASREFLNQRKGVA